VSDAEQGVSQKRPTISRRERTFEYTVALQVDVAAWDMHPDYQNTRNSCLLIVDLIISIAHEPFEFA
jgi:hypothetical protein